VTRPARITYSFSSYRVEDILEMGSPAETAAPTAAEVTAKSTATRRYRIVEIDTNSVI
jgi:hypothetical protein